MSDPLTFKKLSEVSAARSAKWHKGEQWRLSDWGVAAGGEMGELLNVIKKLNRDASNMVGNRNVSREELFNRLGLEAADVVIYLDLLCQSVDIDLGQAIVECFNSKSKEVGFEEML